MENISNHKKNDEGKSSTFEKNGNKKKGASKMGSNKKEKDPKDMDSMQWMIKQLMNEIIDLKKTKGEGKKPFKPFIKKRTNTDAPPQIPTTSIINFGGLYYG